MDSFTNFKIRSDGLMHSTSSRSVSPFQTCPYIPKNPYYDEEKTLDKTADAQVRTPSEGVPKLKANAPQPERIAARNKQTGGLLTSRLPSPVHGFRVLRSGRICIRDHLHDPFRNFPEFEGCPGWAKSLILSEYQVWYYALAFTVFSTSLDGCSSLRVH